VKILHDDGRNFYRGMDAPLIVSVTGHRRIEPKYREQVKDEIRKFFDDISAEYPNSKIILLTPLGEGADRLALEAVQRCKRKILSTAVLPMEKTEYVSTFEGIGYESEDDPIGCSEGHFEKLLSLTDLPTLVISDKEGNHSNEEKKECYRNLGAYLVSSSHMMIAVWDGKKAVSGYEGGTADVAEMANDGIDLDLIYSISWKRNKTDSVPMEKNYLNIVEDCLIYHILIPRDEVDPNLTYPACVYYVPKNFDTFEEDIEDEPLEKTDYDGPDLTYNKYGWKHSMDIPKAYGNILKNIDDFNKEIFEKNFEKGSEKSLNDHIQDQEKNSYIVNLMKMRGDRRKNLRFYNGDWRKDEYRYENGGEKEEFDDDCEKIKGRGLALEMRKRIRKEESLKEMGLRYKVADTLARKYQTKTRRDLGMSLALTAITSMFLALYLMPYQAIMFTMLYALMLVLGFLLYRNHRSTSVHSKFLEYRSLAESMRVNYYWSNIGISDSISEDCFGYLKNNTNWVRFVVKSWDSILLNSFPEMKEEEMDGRAALLTLTWIHSQKKYHKNKMMKNDKTRSKCLKCMQIFIVIAIVTTAFVGISEFLNMEFLWITFFVMPSGFDIILPAGTEITVSTMLKILVASANLTIVAISGYITKLIYGGKQDESMVNKKIFEIAEDRLRDTTFLSDKKKMKKSDVSIQIFKELGRQCIMETNVWVFLHRKKKMESWRKDKDIE